MIPASMIRASEAIAAMQRLPFAPLAAITGNAPVLILAPHADDESLGCGGLIAAASAAGHPPYVLVLTDGTGSHPRSVSYPAARLKAVRQQEARCAVGILGLPADCIGFLDLRDTAAPTEGADFDAAVMAILSIVKRVGATTIAAPWRHDPHCDHLAAHCMAVAAAAQSGVRRLAYPVWGWTLPADAMLDGSLPKGVRLDVSAYAATKQRAIAAHASQYAGLIQDDPTGFQLPAGLLDVFSRSYETYLQQE